MSRSACVSYVRERDHHCCRICGRAVQYENPALDSFGEVHEEPFRSRGGDPANPKQCVLTCQACHKTGRVSLHGPERIRVCYLHPDLGADGPIRVRRRGDEDEDEWACGGCGDVYGPDDESVWDHGSGQLRCVGCGRLGVA
jgi:hypothetical protein